MSDALAIAAVTATIRNLLFLGVNGTVAGADVTAKPLDRARVGNTGNRLNVFLYQTAIDASWRNEDMPGKSLPGENGRPPLPLNLYYLVTAYGDNDDELLGHQLLGRAMGVLHDHPVLGAEEIKDALDDSDLHEQVERIRITPQPMTLEEMSKLWTTFQTQYRMSAAYQARVVLIESRLPVRAGPPVLSIGEGGASGIQVRPEARLPMPRITAVELPDDQPSALLGDTVALTGHDLQDTESIRIATPRLDEPIVIVPDEVTSDRVEFDLPDDPTELPAGLMVVSGGPDDPETGLPTNDVALPLAPEITDIDATRSQAGVVTITVECRPEVVAAQDVLLLVSGHALTPEQFTAPESTIEFKSATLAAGDYPVRLRIDGIDSLLVDRSVTPPVFDPSQVVSVP